MKQRALTTGGLTEPDKSNVLQLNERDWQGKSEVQIRSEIAISPAAAAAHTTRQFSKHSHRDTDLTATLAVIREKTAAVKSNNLADADEMLTSQAITLDAIFNEMARRAALNLGTHIEATETYLRLALKTQGQCRATWEAIAAIKNPPVVYAKQANYSGGGPMQVNNGAQAESALPQAKLLEGRNVEWMDAGAKSSAGGINTVLATVGEVDGPTHLAREAACKPQRVQRSGESNSPSAQRRNSRAPQAASRTPRRGVK